MMTRVALVGAGNMGEAMLRGWLDAGVLQPGQVVLSDRDPGRRAAVTSRYGVAAAETAGAAVVGADYVVLAVKPQDCFEVLDDISPGLGEGAAIISIVAGISTGSIRKRTGTTATVVRVMPNVAALVGASASAFFMEEGGSSADRETVLRLLGAIGEAVEVEEKLMDLVTAVSGSGPAYFFLLTEALERAGVKMGLTRDVASRLAAETLWGAARLLKDTGRDAVDLRDAVSSPGGTTLAALSVLYGRGFEEMVEEAVSAARARAAELAGRD